MTTLHDSQEFLATSIDEEQTPTKPRRSWRTIMSPSSRKLTLDEDNTTKSNTTGRRRRPRRAHTMDNALTRIASESGEEALVDEVAPAMQKRSNSSPLPLSPIKTSTGSGRSGSLLQRFLASTSRRRSQTNLSGEGSTVSRLTDDEPDTVDPTSPAPRMRRATMDNGEITSRKSRSPTQLGSSPSAPIGLRGVLRRFSGDGPVKRRGSHDSIDLDFPEDTIMEKDEYQIVQARLQRRADDLHKSGQIDEAISQWVECLALAEDNTDTLAAKTEILCVLVDLHLQASLGHHHYDGEGGETNNNTEDTSNGPNSMNRHRVAAERYLHRIKPAFVKPVWWSNSKELLDLLVECEAWELALIVAVRLADEPGGLGPTPEQFATIHFQIASQKLDSNRQGEALQHLQTTVKYLQLVNIEKRDMTMYLQVLELLASEYNAQAQSVLALEAYQEILKCSPIEKHASLYCRMAHIHLVSQQLDQALEQLEAAASSLDSAEPSIRLELLQTKGDVYCRLGRMEESLEVYQNALEEAKNPAEKAKILYTLGRLCVRLKRVRLAISYFTREMEITEQELGKHHMSVSRVLHELAKLYDEGLGEHKMALLKLHKALQIELAVLQDCHYAITNCPRCNQVTHRMCLKHANLQRDVSNQIRETKKAQGRIHFKLGDFDKALKTSFDEIHSNHSKAAAR